MKTKAKAELILLAVAIAIECASVTSVSVGNETSNNSQKLKEKEVDKNIEISNINITNAVLKLVHVHQQEMVSAQQSDEERLFKKLMTHYDIVSRPVYNASHTVIVRFGLALIQIQNMDEVDQVLSTYVWYEQNWIDERLKWNPADFNGLAVFRIPSAKLWLPDIVLYNSADEHLLDRQVRAMVGNDGTVFYAPPVKICSTCRIDLTYYPFDRQECRMKFGSWSYDSTQLELVNKSDRIDLTNYMANGEWDLDGVKVVRTVVEYSGCPGELYPDLTFVIQMRRRSLFYWTNIIFPCIWLTVINILSFALPPDSGERVTLGISVFLSFSVFMLLVAENIPPTSDTVPLLSQHLTISMTLNACCLLIAIMLHNFHHATPFERRPLPEWLKELMLNVIAPAIGLNVAECQRTSTLSPKSSSYSLRDAEKQHQSQPQQKMHLNISSKSLQQSISPSFPATPTTPTLNNGFSFKFKSLTCKTVKSPAEDTLKVSNDGENGVLVTLSSNSPPAARKWSKLRQTVSKVQVSKQSPTAAEKLAENVRVLLLNQRKKKVAQSHIIKEWRMFTHVLDRVLLILFTLVSVLANFVYLILVPIANAQG